MKVLYPFSTSFLDYPDNESLSVCVYFLGCNNNCVCCHNKDLKNYYSSKGVSLTKDVFLRYLVSFCIRNKTNKICFMGGDPLFNLNYQFLSKVLKTLNKKYEITIYTGYDINYVKELNLKNFNYVKCGVFNEKLKQVSEKTDNFIRFASKNQKLYDNKYNLLSKEGIYCFNLN